MTMLARLEKWKEQGALSLDQHEHFAKLVREEPFSLFRELSILLYAGVLAFIAGLGWTISTWSQRLGPVLILASLSTLLVASSWYCFSRTSAWSPAEVPAPNPYFDYVVYFSCLIWCIELTYIKSHLKIFSGQWDIYLLATAILFFLLAYRFDNRFVLSLACSSLAAWFGLTVLQWPSFQNGTYRRYALLYCLIVGVSGVALQRLRLKAHFLATYLHIVANILFWTILSGLFDTRHDKLWLPSLLIACAASLALGLRQRQFALVAYASAYGYIGLSVMMLRIIHDPTAIGLYFALTATAMIVMLVQVAHGFGRAQ